MLTPEQEQQLELADYPFLNNPTVQAAAAKWNEAEQLIDEARELLASVDTGVVIGTVLPYLGKLHKVVKVEVTRFGGVQISVQRDCARHCHTTKIGWTTYHGWLTEPKVKRGKPVLKRMQNATE